MCNAITCPIGYDTIPPVLKEIGLFKIGPLKEGKYAIYYGVVWPVVSEEKVTDLTVTGLVSTRCPTNANNMNLCARNTPVAAYSIRGELIKAGANRFTKGIYIVRTAGGHIEISNSANR